MLNNLFHLMQTVMLFGACFLFAAGITMLYFYLANRSMVLSCEEEPEKKEQVRETSEINEPSLFQVM